jgi:antitoxin component YwqK of YwqJK toxin-antitoxin module
MFRLLRLSIISLCLGVAAPARCAQQMRSDLVRSGLAGNVERVETTVASGKNKSYRLLPDGSRQELQDFGNPAEPPSDSAQICHLSKFDRRGRLIEDIDAERPLIEQEPYRYVYSYDSKGVLTEKTGYRVDGSLEEKTKYTDDANSKKSEQLFYSSAGKLESECKFDEHENVVSIVSYGTDGQISLSQIHRYDYAKNGNILEQTYYPPEPLAGAGLTFYAPIGADAQKPSTTSIPIQWRTQFVYDDAGRVREQSRFEPGGSLVEKKVFDERGILRGSEFRLGDMSVTIATFDAEGKEVESHTTAKKGFGSPRAVDDRTSFSYDSHGNLTKMLTIGPDGSLIGRTTNVFEYDYQGNWIKKTETVLNNTWQTEPSVAAFETITEYRRSITYFQNE